MLLRLVAVVVLLSCLLCSTTVDASTNTQANPIPLTLTVPLTNQQLVNPTDITCYQLTLDDNTVRTVVFWAAGKLLVRMEPCQGRPHMKISVYGCPSQTKTVYEFMSAKMVADAIANGQASSIPPAWEWPGDVETLTIDITHKTYYIEVSNYVVGTSQIPSQYSLLTNIFDANSTTAAVPNSMQQLYPLTYESTSIWDRTIIRDNSSDSTNSFSFGGGSSSSVVTIDFYQPGLPGTTGTLPTNYEYSFFVKEITSSIGTSTQGPFVNIVPGLCPGGDLCTTANCRSCSTDYPGCPKEFLTDCSETTLNIATLKTALTNATLPFDAYVKDPTQYTAWTVCGANLTMDRIDATASYVTLANQAARVSTPLVWFPQSGPNIVPNTANQLTLAMQGLLSDNNNVYLINAIVRPKATATQNATETTVYQFMTLQMRTPRYETPTLNDTDYAIIIGVSCGLGACIVIFVGVAILVRHKRKQKLAQRIRMKK